MTLAPDVLRIQAPTLKRDWVGKRVLIERQLENGHTVIPAGARGVVSWKKPGKTEIMIDKCPHCGMQPKITIADERYGRAFTFYEPANG